MPGRVLSEEEVRDRRKRYMRFEYDSVYCGGDMCALLEIIKEYADTIRELQTERDMYKQQIEYWRSSSDQFADKIRERETKMAEMQKSELEFLNIARERAEKLKRAYTLMLSALERMSDTDADDSHWYMGLATDTIAQVKSLTVSKQEEPTASKPTCEQPTHDLSKEVHTDILWRSREGEPM